MLAVGAALLVLFLVIETRAEAPLLPLPLLRLSVAAGPERRRLLLGTSFLTFVFIGTLYMQQVLGYSALETGAAWMAASVTSLAFAGLSQQLVARPRPSFVMGFGMALVAAGTLSAAQVPAGGTFSPNLAGPIIIAGTCAAFAFLPVSIGALAR